MTRFVSSVGFSAHRVTQPVTAYGPSTGDTVVLVHPVQSDTGAQERMQNAVRNIEQILSGMVRSITIETREIDTSAFDRSVDELSVILTENRNPVVCLGGGATDIKHPLFVATLAHINHVRSVMSFSDLQSSGAELPLPDLTTRIPGRTADLFLALAHRMDEPAANIRELAGDIGKSEATVSRYVDQLVDRGLVQKERQDQSKSVELTTTGRLLARNAVRKSDDDDAVGIF